MVGRLAWTLGLGVLASACGTFGFIEDDTNNDGEYCEENDDCTSERCTSANLCGHSFCACEGDLCGPEGQQVSECADGWVCVDVDSILDPVVDFFGGMPREDKGYCQPSCDAGCPEHYACDARGVFCNPDTQWAAPLATIRWDGGAMGELRGNGESRTVEVEEGRTLAIHGSAESPNGTALSRPGWKTTLGSGERAEFDAQSIEVVVPRDSYVRAEFSVSDVNHRSANLTVIFESCNGAGDTCGYQGSGCCNGCDLETNICLDGA